MTPISAEIEDHLFRREAGRMISVLTRIFGVHNLGLAEDVVQDAFCRALEVWKLRGVPENPAAWLMATAKNRALDALRRERTARTFAPELTQWLKSEWTLAPAVAAFFEPKAIQDGQLRMMFSCCHPKLKEDGQVALVLHLLCGFSVGEIAAAFVSTPAAIEKRITRAKHVLAASKRMFDVPAAGADFNPRLAAVQRSLYLLFNEGYHSTTAEVAVRGELCGEALRLTALLLDHVPAATPASFALAALLCFHAARLPGRLDPSGNLYPWAEQDRSRWDARFIAEGERCLNLSARGDTMSEYHLEAAIAWAHVSATRPEDTDWRAIANWYEQLHRQRASPIIALNHAIAVAQYAGPERGLDLIAAIPAAERLKQYPFYPAAQGELELRRGDLAAAHHHFTAAASLARNPAERQFFDTRARVTRRTAGPAL